MLNEKVLKELELYEKEYGKTLSEEVVERVFNKFSEAGHSGFSANYALSYISAMIDDFVGTNNILSESISNCTDPEGLAMQKMICKNIIETYNQMMSLGDDEKKAVLKLLSQKPLTPLYGTDDEWEDVSNFFGDKLPPHKLGEYQNKRDSSIFKTVYTNGMSICTKVDDQIFSNDGGITSYTTGSFGRRQITFPYTEKEPERVYLYQPDEECVPYILTDPKTIEQLRKLNEE